MITGLLIQEALGVGTPFWDNIPTSIQTLVGVAAIFGAGWTWFVRPRMTSIVVEAIAHSSKELREEMAANTKGLRGEIDATRKGLSEEIDATRKGLSEEIAATRKELRGEIDATRKELRGEIDATRKDLSEEIASTRSELSKAIAGNRGEIATNRDSITVVREMISVSRIETRDLLADIRRENHQAHEAIGERISGMRTDTAKLAGAVDVLTALVRGGQDRGETWTP